jgi:dolichol-phosphate mannosyltransferase
METDPVANTPKTLVAVATYNEIENLPRLIDEILRHLPEAQVLVVDDNSPDGTGQWCDRKAAQDPRVHCLHRERKLGLGTATVAAMRYAIQRGCQYLVTMDADFSHPPERLPALLAGMDPLAGPGVDVMIGSRYVPGGGIEGWGLKRRWMSRAVNLYARWCLGLAPKDCSGAFRCYRTAQLAKLDFGAVRSAGYSFQEEVLFRLRRLGVRFGETPIVFVNRRCGVSKIDLGEAVAALWIILTLAMEGLFA